MESETVPSNYLPKGRHINWKEERAVIGALGDTSRYTGTVHDLCSSIDTNYGGSRDPSTVMQA